MARETDGRERNVFGYLTHEFETFEQRPLGDVDSLVLACLSYFQLPPEAEAARTEEGMDLRDLFRDYMQLPPEDQRKGHAVFYVPEL